MPGTAQLINWNELFERCMKDAEFTGQMLDVFIENAPKTLESLEQSLSAGQVADAKRHAHTLKGTAGNLAIESLRSLAATNEKLAADGNLAAVLENVPQIKSLLDHCISEAHSLKEKLKQAA